ncbi:RtcB family protein [bacterium]|nr:RtcB family protein [bacterium]
MEKEKVKKVKPFIWEISSEVDPKMRVPARILASKRILEATFSDRSLDQLVNTAKMSGVVGAVWAMPDIHEGYGAPIGGIIPMDAEEGLVSPGAIGYDILCGMRLFAVPLEAEEVKSRLPYLMDQLFQQVPAGVGKGGEFKFGSKVLDRVLREGARWAVKEGFLDEEEREKIEFGGSLPGDPSAVSSRAKERGKDQLGTLGSGNHFLEVQVVEKVFRPDLAQKLGLSEGQLTVMIHSGSRGLGHQVASDYVALFHRLYPQRGIDLPDPELAALPIRSSEGQKYLGAMRASGNFAFVNRSLIAYLAKRVFKGVFGVNLRMIYDMGHNIAYEDEIEGKKLLIHRKGAGRAKEGDLIILPGSMGTASYLMIGTNTKITFYSVAHGAGRVMSRAKAKRTVWGEELIKKLRKQGIIAKARSLPGLAEEAPLAYKDIDEVARVMQKAGIASAVVRLKPLGVVKG